VGRPVMTCAPLALAPEAKALADTDLELGDVVLPSVVVVVVVATDVGEGSASVLVSSVLVSATLGGGAAFFFWVAAAGGPMPGIGGAMPKVILDAPPGWFKTRDVVRPPPLAKNLAF